MTIPGIGPVGATAFAATVGDASQFRSGRQFAAWLGLTPMQKSSRGKERLGRITKMGDKYLRKLLIVGMTSLVRRAKYKPEAVDPQLADLLARTGADRDRRHGKQGGAGGLGDHDPRRDLPVRACAGAGGIIKFS